MNKETKYRLKRKSHLTVEEEEVGGTDNAKEWHALAVSADAYPMVEYEKVENMNIPTLLLSGSRSGNMNTLIDSRLADLIPDNKRVVIEDAGHKLFMDNPDGSNRAILDFLSDEQSQ